MPAAVAAVAAVAAAGASTAYVVAYAALWVLAYLITFAAIIGVSMLIMRAMMPKKKPVTGEGKLTLQKENAAPMVMLYGGWQRIGGTVVYMNTTNKSNSNKNEYLHMVIALAGRTKNAAGEQRAIEEFEGVYFGETKVADGFGNPIGSKYYGKVECILHNGAYDQPHDPIIQYQLSTSNEIVGANSFQWRGNTISTDVYGQTYLGVWDSGHCGKGIAYLYVRLEYDSKVYSNGIPQISVVAKGPKLYDPRIGSYAATDNAALTIRDYLLNEMGALPNEIDEDSFSLAANECDLGTGANLICTTTAYNEPVSGGLDDFLRVPDNVNLADFTLGMNVESPNMPAGTRVDQIVAVNHKFAVSNFYTKSETPFPIKVSGHSGDRRYGITYSFSSDMKHSDILDDMLAACNGRLFYVGGKFKLKVASYSAPVFNITEEHIIGDVSINTNSSQADVFNAVKGTYIDGPTSKKTDFVEVFSPYYLEQDGEPKYADLTLNAVASHTQARRIAKIALLDSRQDMVVALPIGPIGLGITVGDTVSVTSAKYGWSNKEFLVIKTALNVDLSSTLTLKETSIDIYEWSNVDEDVNKDLTPNTMLRLESDVQPPSFTLSEEAINYVPSVRIHWSGSIDGIVRKVSILKNISGSLNEFSWLGNVDGTRFIDNNVIAGLTYEYKLASVLSTGYVTGYSSSYITIQGDKVAPQNPFAADDVSINVSGTDYYNCAASQQSGSTVIVWNIHPNVDKDYNFTNIQVSNSTSFSSSPLIRVKGNSYTYNSAVGGRYYITAQNFDNSFNSSSLQYGYFDHIGISGITGNKGTDGQSAPFQKTLYRRSKLTPVQPSGVNPSGWVDYVGDGPDALWVVNGTVAADGLSMLVDWSVPKRSSGNISIYSLTQPTGYTLLEGDLWWNIATNVPYRWDGTQWVSLRDVEIPSISSSLDTLGLADTALNNYITNVSSSLNALSGSVANRIYNNEVADYNNSSSLSYRISILDSRTLTDSSSFASRIVNESTARTNLSGSFASTISVLNSTVISNSSSLSATIGNESVARTNLSSSLSSTISTLQSSFTSASSSWNSSINNINVAATNNSSSFASRITTVTATANNASASVSTTSTALANLTSGVSASFSLVVTAGNRVTGFKSEANGTSTSFTIQADKFTVVNTSGGQSKVPFLIDGNGVYIDSAVIRTLDARKITAGTINAAIEMSSATIRGGDIIVTSQVGMRYVNDTGLITITGGSQNGVNCGAQLDIAGSGQTEMKGALMLSAGDGGDSTKGYISLRTGPMYWDAVHGSYANNERMRIQYDGKAYFNGDVGIRNNSKLGFDTTNAVYLQQNYGVEYNTSNVGNLWNLRTAKGLVVGAGAYGQTINPATIAIVQSSDQGTISGCGALWVNETGRLCYRSPSGVLTFLTA